MGHRLAPGFFLLLLASCLAGPPPPAASNPSGSSAMSGGSCGQFKIQKSSDLDACKNKCTDQQRDQQKSCTGGACQAGALLGPCFGACDDGQKAAKQANCYQDK
jgi:hypothetical protein